MAQYEDATIVFTMPNADPHSDEIRKSIENFVATNTNAAAFQSLGQLRYLSAVRHADIVIGNSSSGLIEAPFLKTPTVNIGLRQKGRLSNKSVLHTTGDLPSISKAIEKSLSSEFLNDVWLEPCLYGDGKTSPRILSALTTFNFAGFPRKSFFDLPSNE